MAVSVDDPDADPDQESLDLLKNGPLYPFTDPPRKHIDPTVNRAGVYTIWHKNELVYAGFSGKDGSKSGPVGRLLSHRSGGRSGDKFCIYVCDRYVLPELTSNQIQQVVAGPLKLDERTRDFIRGELTYRFARCENEAVAKALEDKGDSRCPRNTADA